MFRCYRQFLECTFSLNIYFVRYVGYNATNDVMNTKAPNWRLNITNKYVKITITKIWKKYIIFNGCKDCKYCEICEFV